jgi:peptide alpha-N-acetyltransferase
MKFVEPLLKHAADYEETQLLAFEVFIRQGKPILALKTVNEALKIAPSSFRAKRNIVRLARSVEKMDESNAMKKILTMQVGKLMGDKTASEFAASMSFEEASHPVDIAAVAFAKREVGDDSALVEGAKATKMGAEFSLDDYLNALDTYADASEAAAEALTKTCAQAFPYATCFGGAKCTAREN